MPSIAHSSRRTALGLLILTAACSGSSTLNDSLPATSPASEVMSPGGDSLGFVHFPTSCSAAAQSDLELGLALLHHMTYVKAAKAFAAAAQSDPECALAYWGQAMTLVHPLWPDVVSEADRIRSLELLDRAGRAAHTSEREAAYVAALAAYHEGEGRTDAERLASSLAGWSKVHSAYPEDPEAALFYALALLANAPAEDKTYAGQLEAGIVLEGVLDRVPKHPGAHHYTIHAYDFPPLAERALDVARSYDDLAPENSHALHMTSHIFTRLGLWPESIEFNLRAADASAQRMESGALSLHHLHALDYLAYAHLQRADVAAAEEVGKRLESFEPPFQDHAATAYSFAAIPVRLALELHSWERAAALEPRLPAAVNWDRYPPFEALTVFGRAVGAARSGQPAQAREAIAVLQRLEDAASAQDMVYDWATQIRVQRLAAEAWTEFASGEAERGLELALEAANLEASTEKNPVTPGEVLPAQELYGDMLLELGRPAEALAAFELALERSPNRFNSLFGAGRAAELGGDAERAAAYYRKLLEIAPEGDRAELAHARAFAG